MYDGAEQVRHGAHWTNISTKGVFTSQVEPMVGTGNVIRSGQLLNIVKFWKLSFGEILPFLIADKVRLPTCACMCVHTHTHARTQLQSLV